MQVHSNGLLVKEVENLKSTPLETTNSVIKMAITVGCKNIIYIF